MADIFLIFILRLLSLSSVTIATDESVSLVQQFNSIMSDQNI